MKAIYLTKNGPPEEAFAIDETATPEPQSHEILIRVEAFGLNFADVLARQGMYKDAPPFPAILGYEVVGYVRQVGEAAVGFQINQRVVAFTRFGGYAQYVTTDARVAAIIPEEWDKTKALALATQYCTAYYAAYESVNLYPKDNVLIHSAAGGVGTALVQLACLKHCKVFGTTSRDEKIEVMKNNGVDYAINYRKQDFRKAVSRELRDERLDVVFESLGGKYFQQSMKLLGAGGRIVGFGASSRAGGGKNLFSTLKLVAGFGLFSPVQVLMKSQAIIGVYMLAIADYKPLKLQRCLLNVVDLTKQGHLDPHSGGTFKAKQIAEAHQYLQSGQSIGKVAVEWE